MSDTTEHDQPFYRRGGAGEAGAGEPVIPNALVVKPRPLKPQNSKPEKLPPPLQRSRGAHGQLVIFLNFVMTLVVAACTVAVMVFFYMNDAFLKPGPLETNTTFTVRSGAGLAEVANNLERNGIVDSGRIFHSMAGSYLSEGQTLKAGEYEIKAGASMKDIVALLESGKSILYSVAVPEGLTVRQIFARLAGDEILEGDLPASLPPEGSLRPDTYRFTRGTKREDIVNQMHAAQTKLIAMIWERRNPGLPVKTVGDFVTLASIVEKETGKNDERDRVASVFMNRLIKNMRLQSDPTVIYGLFGGEGKPSDRPIYQSDLKKETPFNTYVIHGLPPSPIANPGRAALEAVANPSRTDDLYFVADGAGGHVFARTLDDHNANVKRWRKIEAEKAAADANLQIAIDGAAGRCAGGKAGGE